MVLTDYLKFQNQRRSPVVSVTHIAVIVPTKMVQLKRMRRFIWESITKIEDLEQKVSQDSVRDYLLLSHKDVTQA